MDTEKVKPSALAVQILATLSIAYLTVLTGFVYAWPSYTILNFMTNDTQLSAPMTPTQKNLLGSLTNIGALVTTPFCGYIINTIGRKYSAILFGLPFVLTWTIISLTRDVNLVLFAMTLVGVGAAGQAVSSVYICEIAQDSIRGGLASTTVSGFFIGLLISYVLGGYLTYHQVLYTHLTLSVLYMIMLMLLKESPVFLLQKGKEEEAAKSIAFYRRVSVTSKEVEVEINKLKLQLDPQIDMILQEGNDPDVLKNLMINNKNSDIQTSSSIKFLMNSKSSQRALFCVSMIMTLSILMGSIVLQVYAEPLMKEAAPSIPSNLAAILVAVDFFLASSMCSVIIDKFGRKTLMTYSALGAGACTLLLGVQLTFGFAPHWVTALIIYVYIFIFTIGAGTVPFVLTAELFLPEVRGLCNSICMGCMWVVNFVTLIIFNPLVKSIGLGPVFCGFSAICLIGALYSHFCLPETRGLSADAIQFLFMKKAKKISGA